MSISSTIRDYRVLLTSTSYPRNHADWRGTFIRNICDALSRRGDVQLGVWAPPGELPAGTTQATAIDDSRWLDQLSDEGGISHLLRKSPIQGLIRSAGLLKRLRTAFERAGPVDLYHINWLQCALALPKNDTPALVTVLGNDLKLLRLPAMVFALRRALGDRPVAISPNAEWMAPKLTEQLGSKHCVVPVSFGIDPHWYGIERIHGDQARRDWLVVSRLTRNKIGPLFAWAEPLFREQPRTLHLFGPMQEQMEIPPWVEYHGAASPRELADRWFPGAQGLISLSQHDEGRPQVMLEAMASGLPIIASDLPAHRSLIADGATGRLVASADELRDALTSMENPFENQRLGLASRERASLLFGTWDDCAERYVTIYRDLMRQSRR